MSRIQEAFDNKKAFIGFITAGDPSIDASKRFVCEMARAGADLIEIGIPFSDPVAEGPVIQNADLRALRAGTDTEKVFELAQYAVENTDKPIVFMTYLNPVFKYGYDRFFEKCQKIGVGGIIIPDMPFEEKAEAQSVAEKYGVDVISLIAPTSHDRIKSIAADASGFIYLVSSLGVTGVRSKIETDIEGMIKSIKSVTDVPVAVGFGVSTPEQAQNISRFADGVIVGSAIVRIIEQYGENAAEHVYDYVHKMKKAISD